MKKLICNGILIAYYEIDTKYEDTLFLNTRPILDRNGLKDCCEIDGLVEQINNYHKNQNNE